MSWPSYRERYLPAFSADGIAALPNRSSAVVILTIGAIEQHGPHLPVGVDALLGQIFLDRALPRLPASAPVYVAPPIQVAKSNEHTGFTGTLILHRERLRQQIFAVVHQLVEWGFRRIQVLNTHGGNSSLIKSTLRELKLRYDLELGLLPIAFPLDVEQREALYGIHAGEFETAILMAACPGLVVPAAAVAEWIGALEDPGELRPELAPATYAWKTLDISASGVMGDATAATVEKGERWLDAIAESLAGALRALL